MKRRNQSGDSPGPKHLLTEDSDWSDFEVPILFTQQTSNSNSSQQPDEFPDFLLKLSQESANSCSSFPKFLSTYPSSGNSSDFNVEFTKFNEWKSPKEFEDSLVDFIDEVGTETVASSILHNVKLKKELCRMIFSEAHSEFKKGIKSSIITSRKKKKDRQYLLSITPSLLCEELKEKVT